MKRLLLVVVLISLFFSSLVFAAGTITQNTVRVNSEIYETTFTCTGDASTGAFPSTFTGEDINGVVFCVKTNPGTAPTDDYDIVLNDADGIDIMGGNLADRDTSSSEEAYPKKTGTVKGPITPVITNNTNASAVVVIRVYYYAIN